MSEVLTRVVAAAAAFAATNIDDLVILTALFAVAGTGARLAARSIVAGSYLGIAVLAGLSAAAASGLLLLPDAWVGALGLVPLTMGIAGLVALRRAGERTDEDGPVVLPLAGGTAGIAALTIANGADNVAVWIPLFTGARTAGGATIVVLVFAVLVGVLCLVARTAGTHPAVLRAVGRAGHVAVPVVFVLLGIVVLAEAGTVGAAADAVGL